MPKLSVVGDEPRQLTTGNYVRTVVTVNLVPFTSDNHEGDSLLNRVSKGLLNEQKIFITKLLILKSSTSLYEKFWSQTFKTYG